jgi:hypothetical protein
MRPTVVPEQPPSVLHVGEVPKSLATALRKAVTFGGELKSVPLREWASRELRGYEAARAARNSRTTDGSPRPAAT